MLRNKDSFNTTEKKKRIKRTLNLADMYYIEAQYNDGIPIHKIAKDLGCSPQLIHAFVTRL